MSSDFASSSKTKKRSVGWTKEHTGILLGYFRTGKADPIDQSPTYINRLFEANSWIQEIYPKGPRQFHKIYRGKAALFLSELNQHGVRRSKLQAIDLQFILILYSNSKCLR